MKTLSYILILAFSLVITACGSPKNDRKSPGAQEFTGTPNKPPQPEATPVSEVTSPPEGEQPNFKVGQNYVIKSNKQVFRLNFLSHLVATNFVCKVQLRSEMPNTAIQLVEGEMKISFYPEFRITMNNKDFASPNSLCGESARENGIIGKGQGGLFKNETNNSYELTYAMDVADPVRLKMVWDAAGDKGRLICKKTTSGTIMTGTIESCALFRNPLVK